VLVFVVSFALRVTETSLFFLFELACYCSADGIKKGQDITRSLEGITRGNAAESPQAPRFSLLKMQQQSSVLRLRAMQHARAKPGAALK